MVKKKMDKIQADPQWRHVKAQHGCAGDEREATESR